MRELGMATAPCVIIPSHVTADKLRAYTILDNSSMGEWDWGMLQADWDTAQLDDWGVDPIDIEEVAKETATEKLSKLEFTGMYYEPKEDVDLRLSDCIDTTKFDAKMAIIDASTLTEEQKAVMRMFTYRFLKINFEAVANYYQFNATEEEQRVIERLRMVLVDAGSIDGFIEDDLLKIRTAVMNAEDE